MTVVLLATLEDFFLARGEDPPIDSEHDDVMRAKLALAIASDVVRTVCGRDFAPVEATVVLDGTGTDSLVLPDPPITEVTSVTSLSSSGDETEIETTKYRLDPKPGVLRRIDGAVWPSGWLNLEVELAGGYRLPGSEDESGPDIPDLPMDIQGVVIELASAVFDERDGAGVGDLKSASLDGYSETYATMIRNMATGMTSSQSATLSAYRAVGVA